MDASFLHIEGPTNPMHIGGVSIFEGPAPPFERLEEMVAAKLDFVPRYRQQTATSRCGGSFAGAPAPPFERLEEMVASKLDFVPRYRQQTATSRCGRSGRWRA